MRCLRGSRSCLGPRVLSGAERQAAREGKADRKQQASKATSKATTSKQAYRGFWWILMDFRGIWGVFSDFPAPAAGNCWGRVLSLLYYPVRGLTEHSIRYKGPLSFARRGSGPGTRAPHTRGENAHSGTSFPGFDPTKPGISGRKKNGREIIG